MIGAAWALYGISLVMALVALTAWRHSGRRRLAAAIVARIEGVPVVDPAGGGRAGALERFLERYHLPLSLAQALGLVAGVIVFAVLVGLWLGVLWGGGALGSTLVAASAGLSSRKARFRQRMQAQLPAMLDHAIRALRSGSTLSAALINAATEVGSPLSDVMKRVDRMVRHGEALGDSLEDVSNLHGLDELRILAMTVRVNTRYGGSAVDLMETLITIIRQRDKAHRELRAMTGETRLTAWLLGCLPLALVGYIVATNPGYIQLMWEDGTGRWILAGAAVWQMVGVVILRHMIKRL